MIILRVKSVATVVIVLSVVGCGGGPPAVDPAIQERKTELDQIHAMYTHFLKANQAPPKQLADLTKKQYEGVSPFGVEGLKSGKYVFVFGVESKVGATVLAYEKDAGKNGGAVLFGDGTVKVVAADEFKALKPGG